MLFVYSIYIFRLFLLAFVRMVVRLSFGVVVVAVIVICLSPSFLGVFLSSIVTIRSYVCIPHIYYELLFNENATGEKIPVT